MWRRIVIAGLIVLLLAGLAFLVLRKDEPTYQNRRISLILDDWAAGKPGVPVNEALAAIGTNALPYAVRTLARNDSNWRQKYRDTWPKLPKFLKSILRQPKPNSPVGGGGRVFSAIGPSAVPLAIELLQHSSPSVREAAAYGIQTLRLHTTAASAAIPALSQALQDPEPKVRASAMWALATMGPDASNAVPTLTKVLANAGAGPQTGGFFYQRGNAAFVLGKIGPAAGQAVPTLKSALQVPNPYLRGQAAVALWHIDGDAETALSTLLQLMPFTHESDKRDWLIALSEMGPRAVSALPQLERELSQDEYPEILVQVTNALLSIDTVAAGKFGVFPIAPRK